MGDGGSCVLDGGRDRDGELRDEEVIEGGVGGDLIGLCVGIENVKDIIGEVEEGMGEV